MVIFVLRHGETKWNVEKRVQGTRGARLNKKGLEQANAVARTLQKQAVDVIISSPIVRAMQTAHVVNKAHHLHIIKDKGFIERKSGALEGLTRRGILKLLPNIDVQQKRLGIDWRPPKGETLREVHKRAVTHFARIARKYNARTVIVVSHGWVIKALAHHLHGGTPETVFDRKSPDNAELFELHCKLNGKSVLCRLAGRRNWIALK